MTLFTGLPVLCCICLSSWHQGLLLLFSQPHCLTKCTQWPHPCLPSEENASEQTLVHVDSTLAQFVEILTKPHSVPGAGCTLALPNFFQWSLLSAPYCSPRFSKTSPPGWIILASDSVLAGFSPSCCMAENTETLQSEGLGLCQSSWASILPSKCWELK